MIVIKQINNNTALAIDNEGHETIIMGKGIGFKRTPYELYDTSIIERSFYDFDKQYIEMIQSIPQNILDASSKITLKIKQEFDSQMNPNLTFTLANHIYFAINRLKQGITVSMPFSYDVQHLYNKEYSLGLEALKIIEKHTNINLPKSEAINIALHLIDAETNQTNLHETLEMLNTIDEINAIINTSFNIQIDKEGYHYSRFVLHLRHILQRLHQRKEIETYDLKLFQSLAQSFPAIYNCVSKIGDYLEEKKNWYRNDEDLFDLMLHVVRLVNTNDD